MQKKNVRKPSKKKTKSTTKKIFNNGKLKTEDTFTTADQTRRDQTNGRMVETNTEQKLCHSIRLKIEKRTKDETRKQFKRCK